jgi:lipopolysaccharide biosynthesis glycosyltransferase
MTLDATYLWGSVLGVFSMLRHASCPENILFHFIITERGHDDICRVVTTTFSYLSFRLYHLDSNLVKAMISYSIRRALDQPLNYTRIYLIDLLPSIVGRNICFNSDLIVVDDVEKLWRIDLGNHVLGARKYCHVNFMSYFTVAF